MKLYGVWFRTGEYDDRREEIVGVFDSKAKAEKYANKCRSLLNDAGVHREGNNVNARTNCRIYGCDYMGGEYKVEKLPTLNNEQMPTAEGGHRY